MITIATIARRAINIKTYSCITWKESIDDKSSALEAFSLISHLCHDKWMFLLGLCVYISFLTIVDTLELLLKILIAQQ